MWGFFGFLGNLVNALTMMTTNGMGVGTSAYIGSIALIWIGGMLFFSLGSMLWPRGKSEFARGMAAIAGPPGPRPICRPNAIDRYFGEKEPEASNDAFEPTAPDYSYGKGWNK